MAWFPADREVIPRARASADRQVEDDVQGAARLEAAGALQELELEPILGALGQPPWRLATVIGQRRRRNDMGRDAFPGGFYFT